MATDVPPLPEQAVMAIADIFADTLSAFQIHAIWEQIEMLTQEPLMVAEGSPLWAIYEAAEHAGHRQPPIR